MLHRPIALALLLLTGCGRSDLDVPVGRDVGGESDGGVVIVACDLTKPFSTPVPLPGEAVNGLGTAFDFRLAPDELHGYFASNRDGTYPYTTDVYEVTRATRDGVFEGAVLQGLSNYPNDPVGSPNVGADSLTMYFVGTVGFLDGMQEQPRVAMRPNASSQFAHATPLLIPVPRNTHSEGLFVPPDGLAAYFVLGAQPQLHLSGIAVARRLSTSAAFGPPELLVRQDFAEATLGTPVVTPDELTMFLSGSAGWQSHVWMATRAGRDEPFSSPQPVHELDSPGGEWPTWISADGCRLFMTRGILDDAGTLYSSRVYAAARPPR